MYGMLAALLAASSPHWGRKVALWTTALLIAGLVGLAQLYLGAHWLTDVLGALTLGAVWLFVLLTAARTVGALHGETPATDPPASGSQPAEAAPPPVATSGIPRDPRGDNRKAGDSRARRSVAELLNRAAQHQPGRLLAPVAATWLLVVAVLAVLWLAACAARRREAHPLSLLALATVGTVAAFGLHQLLDRLYFRPRPCWALPAVHAIGARRGTVCPSLGSLAAAATLPG